MTCHQYLMSLEQLTITISYSGGVFDRLHFQETLYHLQNKNK